MAGTKRKMLYTCMRCTKGMLIFCLGMQKCGVHLQPRTPFQIGIDWNVVPFWMCRKAVKWQETYVGATQMRMPPSEVPKIADLALLLSMGRWYQERRNVSMTFNDPINPSWRESASHLIQKSLEQIHPFVSLWELQIVPQWCDRNPCFVICSCFSLSQQHIRFPYLTSSGVQNYISINTVKHRATRRERPPTRQVGAI